jgi:group I intron endonuclease
MGVVMHTVYLIRNLVNWKVYIGQTGRDVCIRFREHLNDTHKKNANLRFQRAIKKYGPQNFELKALQYVPNEPKALELEKWYIEKFESWKKNKGYNLSMGGGGAGVMLPEIKSRISKTLKGRVFSEETRQKIGLKHKGKVISTEMRRVLSEHAKRRFSDPEARLAASQRSKELWKDSDYRRRSEEANRSPETTERRRLSHLGQKRSEEAKYNMSLAQLGKRRSLEAIKKGAEANRGKKRSVKFCEQASERILGEKNQWFGKTLSEEHRKNIGLGLLGKKRGPRSEETKRKISQALKGRKIGV